MTKQPARDPTRYVAIHGHFYQPPRENPWLEELEREESAHPCHDWNERILEECYKPNAAARILDGNNQIVDLVNNYESMSFNIGPTLLRWMERHARWTYDQILEADRKSCARLAGHGNAVAQVYNHAILPLCNRRDKVTQVRWGIRDFEHRFKRKPEGMWLAETAVDRETLEVLSENGIAFTILSPFQAKRFRALDGGAVWTEAPDGSIPAGRAYLYPLKGQRPVHLFFYDGAIARGIAFDRLLADASHLVTSVEAAHGRQPSSSVEPWLVHTATDGESYGHHFKFGDMALAAAFRQLHAGAWRSVNHAWFLASFPVRAEAEILDVSAWSCAHGVDRWRADCGCSTGRPGFNQRWRAPLREALDGLRDALAVHFERALARLVRDPWLTRDDYIEVVLDPSAAGALVREHARHALSDSERVLLFQLLEMQRAALLMFTSCGWFFDDVTGQETVILLRYAARAIELCRKTGGPDVEPPFLRLLSSAVSNLPSKTTGAELYQSQALATAVDVPKVVVSHAVQRLASGSRRESALYTYRVTHHEEVPLGNALAPALFGRVVVEDTRTTESADALYALVHFGGLDFHCAVKPYVSHDDFAVTLQALKDSIVDQSATRLMRALDVHFGAASYTLQDAFLDLRGRIALDISAERFAIYTELQHHLYEVNRPLLSSLRQHGVPLPTSLVPLVGRVLTDQVTALIDAFVEGHLGDEPRRTSEDVEFAWRALLGQVRVILDDAQRFGARLDLDHCSNVLGHALVDVVGQLERTFTVEGATLLLRVLDTSLQLGLKPALWELQTSYHRLISGAPHDDALAQGLAQHPKLVLALDSFCGCRFAARVPAASS